MEMMRGQVEEVRRFCGDLGMDGEVLVLETFHENIIIVEIHV